MIRNVLFATFKTSMFFSKQNQILFQSWIVSHISVPLRQPSPTGNCLSRKPLRVSDLGKVDRLAQRCWPAWEGQQDVCGWDISRPPHLAVACLQIRSVFVSAVPLMQHSPLFLWSASPNVMFPQSLSTKLCSGKWGNLLFLRLFSMINKIKTCKSC